MNDNGQSGTREQILKAALHLFAERGYPQTSMDEIAKEVGVTKPAIYHYFDSKEKLFQALVELAKAEQRRRLDEARAKNLPLPELLEYIINAALAMVREEPDWVRMMIRVNSYAHELADLVDLAALEREMHDEDTALLADALAGARLRPGLSVGDFVDFYHGVLYSLMSRCFLMSGLLDREDIAANLRDLILYGALARP
jgi:AcrR family transcriptional regulator